MNRSLRLFSSALVLGLLSSQGISQDSYTREDLERYEREQAEAERKLQAIEVATNDAETDLSSLNRLLLSAAQDARRREEQAANIQKKLIDLNIRIDVARNDLMADEAGFQDLLAALTVSSRRRPPALFVQPDNAGAAIRSAILMRDTASDLKLRSTSLRKDIRAFDRLIRSMQNERDRLKAAEDVLGERQLEIETLAAQKRAIFEDVSSEAETLRKTVTSLAKKADTIRSLLKSLEAKAPLAPSLKPRSLRGRIQEQSQLAKNVLKALGMPVSGELTQKFGQRTPTGRKSEGITLATRHSAQVTAPADADIEYAGDFRSYGKMLILRTGDGYHIVLTGLSDIYGVRGQSVLAGEPIGRMGERKDVKQQLYMELRKDGAPLDPARWMTSQSG